MFGTDRELGTRLSINVEIAVSGIMLLVIMLFYSLMLCSVIMFGSMLLFCNIWVRTCFNWMSAKLWVFRLLEETVGNGFSESVCYRFWMLGVKLVLIFG